MPHRGPRASLRQLQGKEQASSIDGNESQVSEFRKMSSIQILKFGLNGNLWKKKGWLMDLLKREGLSDGSKRNKKKNYAGVTTKARCSTLKRFKMQKMTWSLIRAGTTTRQGKMGDL
jgi:hypothetical protein